MSRPAIELRDHLAEGVLGVVGALLHDIASSEKSGRLLLNLIGGLCFLFFLRPASHRPQGVSVAAESPPVDGRTLRKAIAQTPGSLIAGLLPDRLDFEADPADNLVERRLRPAHPLSAKTFCLTEERLSPCP